MSDLEAQAGLPDGEVYSPLPSREQGNGDGIINASTSGVNPITQPDPGRDSPDSTKEKSSVKSMGHSTISLSSSEEDIEERNLFLFAEHLRLDPNPEPWFMEMTRLRRLHFLYLNKQLAACRKQILEKQLASDDDMTRLAALLRQQADAIRDFQYIRCLDFLPPEEPAQREKQSIDHFPLTAQSDFSDIFPFQTENYRCLPRESTDAVRLDGIRDFLRRRMPVRWSWTDEEKKAKRELYELQYNPKVLSPFLDRFAGFIVAFTGALFILVPMYIMVFGNETRNLITTTVAVILFAILCSIPLRASNEQTLGATVSYAAVLMVFVGLTTESNR